MKLVRASEWMKPGLPLPGAHNADMILPVGTVFIHHAAGPSPINEAAEVAMLQQDDAYHRSKGWDGLGYSFVIGPSGTVYEGRGQKVGAHTMANNRTAFGICFLGNFMTALPTPAAMMACAELIQLLRQANPGFGLPHGALVPDSAIKGHRDAIVNGAPYPTSCPGDQLYANLPNLRRLVGEANAMPTSTPKENPVSDRPRVNAPATGIAITPTGQGYLILCADGGVFAFGDAKFLGNVEYDLPAGDDWSPADQ